MRQRYFLIEPEYCDGDTFCHFVVGSSYARASLRMYADLWLFKEVAAALQAPSLSAEHPVHPEWMGDDAGPLFFIYPTVLPHTGGNRHLKFRVFHEMTGDGAPYRAQITFELTPQESAELSKELIAWCDNPKYTFVWSVF